jgi:hypothetical protein
MHPRRKKKYARWCERPLLLLLGSSPESWEGQVLADNGSF